jgi:hypothetical protein
MPICEDFVMGEVEERRRYCLEQAINLIHGSSNSTTVVSYAQDLELFLTRKVKND